MIVGGFSDAHWGRASAVVVLFTSLGSLAAACGGGEDARTGPSGGGGDGSAAAGAGGAGALSSGGGPTGGTASGTGGTPDATTLTPYQACVAYIDMQCNRTDYECAGVEAVGDPCPEYRTLCPDFIFAPGSNFTVEDIVACTEQWRVMPCERLNAGEYPECGPGGDLADGQPCLFSRQCQSLHCTGNPFGTCGQCSPMGTIGDPCPEFGCPSGTECVGTCEPSVQFNLPPGAPCERYGQCQAGYVCAADSVSGEDRCAVLAALGESCAAYHTCEGGAYCDAATERCMAVPAAGEPCATGVALGNSACADDSYCDTATQVCTPRDAAGTPCTPVTDRLDFVSTCELDLRCFCDDGTCATGTCLEPRNDGERCDEMNVRCVDGTTCVAGTCVGVELQGSFDAACTAMP